MKIAYLIIPTILILSFACSSEKAPQKLNVLLLCVDDLRPELNSFGVEYIHSPNMDKLAEKGRAFHHHYVNAPSCGPSRFTLLTGRYGPPSNYALFQRADSLNNNPKSFPPSMPEWFRRNGYTTVSVGKVSHHPGGRGGKGWNDSTKIEIPKAWDKHLMPCGEWQTPEGAMHGLANGEVRKEAGDMDVFQSEEGPDSIYPDGLIAEAGLRQIRALSSNQEKPFFLAIGLIKPHLPFGAPKQYMDRYQGVEIPPIEHARKPDGTTTWHGSGEFMKYNRWERDPRVDSAFAEEVKRHYAACVTYADMHVGKILDELKNSGADKNTIVVLWGDHGWHLGEHAIWGKHSLFEESLRSPLIVYYPEMNKPGMKINSVVETLDIFPTLCELTGLEMPGFLDGVSLKSMLEEPIAAGHPALAYKGDAKTIRTSSHRLIVHNNGFVELYDHRLPEKETKNIANDYPEVVAELKRILERKMEASSFYSKN